MLSNRSTAISPNAIRAPIGRKRRTQLPTNATRSDTSNEIARSEKNKKEDKGGSDVLSMMAVSEVEDDLLVVSDGHRQNTDVWTLDSAFSHHYTPKPILVRYIHQDG